MRLIKAIGITMGILGGFILVLQVIIWCLLLQPWVQDIILGIIAFGMVTAMVYLILDSEESDSRG